MPQQEIKQATQEQLKMPGRELLSADAGGNITTINEEQRTVDVVFFTGIDVPRRDPWTGESYLRRFDAKGADLSLLNNKAPVLDNHDSFSGIDAVKGVVEKAWKAGGNYLATLRFAKTPDAESLWQKITQGIVTKISMGTDVLAEETLTEKGPKGQPVKVRMATMWQPFELSMVPIPADFGTTTLSADGNASGGTTQRTEVRNLEEESMEQTQLNTAPAASPAVPPAAPSAEQLAQQAAQDERLRITTIEELGEQNHIPAKLIARHKQAGTPVEDFRRIVADLVEMAAASNINPQQSARTEILTDERDTHRELMGAVIGNMMIPGSVKDKPENPYQGLKLSRIAEESVRRQHNLRDIPSMHKVVELAMQTTSDFANVLENSARKALTGKYEYATPTYRTWAKRSTTPDFKTMSRSALSEVAQFLQVAEGAQITIGTMSDRKETYALATYGRGLSFTRQMLINDDLGAFTDLIGQFGVQAARLENKTVYAILTANAALSDGITLFHSSSHGANSGSGAITNANLDAGWTVMRKQKGMDNLTVLNISPKYLIVPAAKEWTARSVVMPVTANVKASDQNWFAGKLEVVADAELDGTSLTAWYLAADPGMAPGVEYCFLEGAEGPQFIRKENEGGILGLQFFAFEDFGAKALDYRPLYYSTGA